MRSVPHRLLCSNTWSSVGDASWGGVKDLVLLEEVYQWGWALKVYSHIPIQSFCFMFAVEDVISQVPGPAAMPIAYSHASLPRWTHPSGTTNQYKPLLL